MTLEELYNVIQARRMAATDESYVARLLASGIDRMAQKVGEEAVEVVIASKNDDDAMMIGEVSDLFFHLLVLMNARNITLDDIQRELGARHAKKNA